MLYRELNSLVADHHDDVFLTYKGQKWTFADILSQAELHLQAFARLKRCRIGIYVDDSPTLVSLLIALDQLETEACLISGDTSLSKVRSLLSDMALECCLTDKDIGSPPFISLHGPAFPLLDAQPVSFSNGSRIVLFTSGTSGKPKGALHTWDSLAAGIKRDARFSRCRWLLTYGLTRFAGVQVFLQAFLTGSLLAISPADDVGAILQLLEAEGIAYVSGTPTFWRKALTAATPAQLSRLVLRQISLGGEIVSEGILNALRFAFPQAQITHIYASTEMGVCFSVKDGRAGFPVELLDGIDGDVGLKVKDGELWIRSRRAMEHYVHESAKHEWFASGDLVEIRDGRVYFLGRRTETINVGGSKVFPAEIEDEIRKVPGVMDTRVFGTPSSFTGQLVSADVIGAPGFVESELQTLIRKQCASLPPYKQPRILRFVERLEETDSRKLIRQ